MRLELSRDTEDWRLDLRCDHCGQTLNDDLQVVVAIVAHPVDLVPVHQSAGPQILHRRCLPQFSADRLQEDADRQILWTLANRERLLQGLDDPVVQISQDYERRISQ